MNKCKRCVTNSIHRFWIRTKAFFYAMNNSEFQTVVEIDSLRNNYIMHHRYGAEGIRELAKDILEKLKQM